MVGYGIMVWYSMVWHCKLHINMCIYIHPLVYYIHVCIYNSLYPDSELQCTAQPKQCQQLHDAKEMRLTVTWLLLVLLHICVCIQIYTFRYMPVCLSVLYYIPLSIYILFTYKLTLWIHAYIMYPHAGWQLWIAVIPFQSLQVAIYESAVQPFSQSVKPASQPAIC